MTGVQTCALPISALIISVYKNTADLAVVLKSAKPDTRSAYDSGQSSDLQKCLDFRAATFCRDMIKHKKLNDTNNIFNRMV